MTDHDGPPDHLTDESAAWWRALHEAFHFEAHHLRLLEAACTAWDRAEEARRTVEEAGPVFNDRFGQPKAHPAVAIERKARNEFRLLLRELGLDVAPPNEAHAPAPPANADLKAV